MPTTKGCGIMKRNHEIKIRFNEKEFEQLTEKVRKSKLSREKFIRQMYFEKISQRTTSFGLL